MWTITSWGAIRPRGWPVGQYLGAATEFGFLTPAQSTRPTVLTPVAGGVRMRIVSLERALSYLGRSGVSFDRLEDAPSSARRCGACSGHLSAMQLQLHVVIHTPVPCAMQLTLLSPATTTRRDPHARALCHAADLVQLQLHVVIHTPVSGVQSAICLASMPLTFPVRLLGGRT